MLTRGSWGLREGSAPACVTWRFRIAWYCVCGVCGLSFSKYYGTYMTSHSKWASPHCNDRTNSHAPRLHSSFSSCTPKVFFTVIVGHGYRHAISHTTHPASYVVRLDYPTMTSKVRTFSDQRQAKSGRMRSRTVWCSHSLSGPSCRLVTLPTHDYRSKRVPEACLSQQGHHSRSGQWDCEA